MKIRFSISSVLIAGVLTLATSTSAFSQTACEPSKLAQKYPSLVGKTLKIGVDAQTPPYVMRDPKQFSNLIGFDADLAREVFDCAGIKYEFFVGGWSGLLPALNAKQIDVFWNNLYFTADRAKQVNFVTYMQAGTGALVAAGNPKKITGFDQMCGTTVAAKSHKSEAKMRNARLQASLGSISWCFQM